MCEHSQGTTVCHAYEGLFEELPLAFSPHLSTTTKNMSSLMNAMIDPKFMPDLLQTKETHFGRE
jgi:hypothetical protein